MNYTIPLNLVGKNSVQAVGGKGSSLGEMLASGIPVPQGFVVHSRAFDTFLENTGLGTKIQKLLSRVSLDLPQMIGETSDIIQGMIKGVMMPAEMVNQIFSEFRKLDYEFVAVRSSATVEDGFEYAWAGQLESFLNCKESNVIEMVQSCWASLFTPRALFYRLENKLYDHNISVAVVVQGMVNSEKSGTAFSVHPISEDHNQIIIEAGFGLGEAVVSGSITPDSYTVEKQTRKIIDVTINNKKSALYRNEYGKNEWSTLGERGLTQVLNEDEIFYLTDLIVKIENHYNFPVDIEWALEGKKIYILQSRPITTIRNFTT